MERHLYDPTLKEGFQGKENTSVNSCITTTSFECIKKLYFLWDEKIGFLPYQIQKNLSSKVNCRQTHNGAMLYRKWFLL